MLQGGSSVTMKRYYRHGIVASIEIWKLVRDWYKRLFLKRMFSKKWMAGFTPNFATRWATITPTKSLVQTFTPRSRCILSSCDQMHNNLSDPNLELQKHYASQKFAPKSKAKYKKTRHTWTTVMIEITCSTHQWLSLQSNVIIQVKNVFQNNNSTYIMAVIFLAIRLVVFVGDDKTPLTYLRITSTIQVVCVFLLQPTQTRNRQHHISLIRS